MSDLLDWIDLLGLSDLPGNLLDTGVGTTAQVVGLPSLFLVGLLLAVTAAASLGPPSETKAILAGLIGCVLVVVTPVFPVAAHIAEGRFGARALLFTAGLWLVVLLPASVTLLLDLRLIERWWRARDAPAAGVDGVSGGRSATG